MQVERDEGILVDVDEAKKVEDEVEDVEEAEEVATRIKVDKV